MSDEIIEEEVVVAEGEEVEEKDEEETEEAEEVAADAE